MTVAVIALQPGGIEMSGYLPTFLSEDDPRPVREQLDAAYQHGGGWSPMQGWTLDLKTRAIAYPGDPPLEPIAVMAVRDEAVFVYPHAWVVVLSAPDKFEIARMD